MEEKTKGKLEQIGEITELASGKGINIAWTLFGSKIIVDGEEYGYSNFKKEVLKGKLEKIKIGSIVEFETEERGEYTNVKSGTDIKVIEEGKGTAGPAPPGKKLTDNEIENTWKECADFVIKYWNDKKIKIDSVDMIGPSINTLFMDKMKKKRKR